MTNKILDFFNKSVILVEHITSFDKGAERNTSVFRLTKSQIAVSTIVVIAKTWYAFNRSRKGEDLD